MTINLHDLTGQESGIILVETDDRFGGASPVF